MNKTLNNVIYYFILFSLKLILISNSKRNGKSVKFSSRRFSLPIGTFLAVWGLPHTHQIPHTAKMVPMESEKSPGREKIPLEKITDSPFCLT